MGCSQMNKVIEKVFSGSMLMSFILASCNLQTASNVSAMESTSNILIGETSNTETKENITKAATPEQQEEIAEVLYNDIKRYWDRRDIEWHIENEEHNSDEIDVVYRKFFDSGNTIYDSNITYGKKLKFDEERYEEALKKGSKNWDCKILSGHVANVLKKLGIKHRCISFANSGGVHTCIIYAVSEVSKTGETEENWYVLDMEIMRKAESQKRYFKCEITNFKPEVYFPLKSPIDAARIPLEVYADNQYFGFYGVSSVFVYGDDENALLDKTGIARNNMLIGEWVYRNCTENFKKKFLVMNVADTEIGSCYGHRRPVVENLDKISRRLFVEERLPLPSAYRSFSLIFFHNGQLKQSKMSNLMLLSDGFEGYLLNEHEEFLKTSESGMTSYVS